MGYSSSRANLSNPREGYASLGVRALGLEQQYTLMPLPLGVAVPLMRVSLGRGEERATNKTNPLPRTAFPACFWAVKLLYWRNSFFHPIGVQHVRS